MKQVHERVCEAHQSGIKMRWLIRRYVYYCPSILKDCIKYAKGRQSCQKHGNIQRIPTDELHNVVKPWPFKGWAMDLIGKIYPVLSKGHSFILVATYFLTKWVEAVPLKKAEQGDVINFVKDNIIHRFGIPESLTMDQGTMFTGSDMRDFTEDCGIKLINLLPLEIMVPSMRVVRQTELSLEHYNEAMIMDLEELDELRIQAYNALLLQKQKVARIYNIRVNKKSFHEGEIVWKDLLPLGTKDRELIKWSPNWEGPFKVHKVLDGNAYWL
ncbi:uncharacterized protein [Primulina eburnea]|uniref:uncharacterized protein n=1 Tax=Primulina eburnea TaxID=1245227 RepID=UPI003C6C5141